jgi:hypothetical protein
MEVGGFLGWKKKTLIKLKVEAWARQNSLNYFDLFAWKQQEPRVEAESLVGGIQKRILRKSDDDARQLAAPQIGDPVAIHFVILLKVAVKNAIIITLN